MTERKARTGARFASEKQVLRCAQNDSQKSNGKDKSNGNSNSNSKGRSRFPSGMTTRKAKARAKMHGSLHYSLLLIQGRLHLHTHGFHQGFAGLKGLRVERG
jgi:hypothetical protein